MRIKAINDILISLVFFIYMISDDILDSLEIVRDERVYYNNKISAFFYFILAFYICINKFQDAKITVLRVYKRVFKGTAIFFLVFLLIEGYLFFDISKYREIIIESNTFVSGAFTLFIIYIYITFKNCRNVTKDER